MLDYDNLTWKEGTLIETMLIELFACEETFLATITFDRGTLLFLFRCDAWIDATRSDRFRGKFYRDKDRSFIIAIVTSRTRWFTFRGGDGIVILVLRNCKENTSLERPIGLEIYHLAWSLVDSSVYDVTWSCRSSRKRIL